MGDGALRLDDEDSSPLLTDSVMASPQPNPSAAPRHVAIQASATPPAPAEQMSTIRELAKQPIAAGAVWHAVSRAWYKKWSVSCAPNEASKEDEELLDVYGQVEVGPINSSDLEAPVDAVGMPGYTPLAPHLQDGVHYELLPQEAFNLLASWYGVQGPIFERKAVTVQPNAPAIVELYLPIFGFSRIVRKLDGIGRNRGPIVISKAELLQRLRQAAMESLDIQELNVTDVRLWQLSPTQAAWPQVLTHVSKEEGHQCISEDRLHEPIDSIVDRPADQVIALGVEIKEGDGQWPSEVQEVVAAPKKLFAQEKDFFAQKVQADRTVPGSYQSVGMAAAAEPAVAGSSRLTRSKTAHERGSAGPRGLRGLQNLGNTCFMNSALQCLSNTPELKDYFVSRVFESEINAENPLGNGGQLAQQFGKLIQHIWSGSRDTVVPRDFKSALSRFAPQFSGYAQQDTQELLAFLLDGLHEDLNRIKKKPYIEAPDWEGGGLEEMVQFAKRQWEIYKMRNDSVIVDLFQGQYRSTLICPVCTKVSVKFDPFMYLTLPLPNTRLWHHQVTFVPWDPDRPSRKINCALPLEASVSKLKQDIAEAVGTDAKRLLGAEIWHDKVYRYFQDYEPVMHIEKNDHAYVWELPGEAKVVAPKARKNSHRFQSKEYSPPVRLPSEEESFGHAPPEGCEKDEWIVMPVFTKTRRNGSIGPPFFVAIAQEDANNLSKIQETIARQYRRYSTRPDELLSRLASLDQQIPASASRGSGSGSNSEWEVVNEPQVDNLAANAAGPADTFAEIRMGDDGQIFETTEAAPVESSSGGQPSGIIEIKSDSDTIQQPDSAAPPTVEFHYMVNASSTRPLLKDAENWYNLSEPLGERAHRLQQQAIIDAKSDNSPAGVPLIYRGGAIVCVWDESIEYDLFSRAEKTTGEWGYFGDEIDDAKVAAVKAEHASGKRKGKMQLSIEDCLNEFTREEQLGEEDLWYCPDCKAFQQATKKFDLWKVPDILVVHLKRFSAGRGLRDKIDTVVDFPIEGLDLTDRVEGAKAVQELKAQGKRDAYSQDAGPKPTDGGNDAASDGSSSPSHHLPADEDPMSASVLSAISEANDDAVATDAPIYDLFAVDDHYGGLGGGHYTSYARNADDGRWYKFDDTRVSSLRDPEEVKGPAAYLLFYRRRTTRSIGGRSREIVKNAQPSGLGGPVFTAGDDAFAPPVSGSGSVTENEEPDLTGANTRPGREFNPLPPSRQMPSNSYDGLPMSLVGSWGGSPPSPTRASSAVSSPPSDDSYKHQHDNHDDPLDEEEENRRQRQSMPGGYEDSGDEAGGAFSRGRSGIYGRHGSAAFGGYDNGSPMLGNWAGYGDTLPSYDSIDGTSPVVHVRDYQPELDDVPEKRVGLFGGYPTTVAATRNGDEEEEEEEELEEDELHVQPKTALPNDPNWDALVSRATAQPASSSDDEESSSSQVETAAEELEEEKEEEKPVSVKKKVGQGAQEV